MTNVIFVIENLGSTTIERCPGAKPYPSRRMTVKEFGRWGTNKFIGTTLDKDALLDLHVGDIVKANLKFYVSKEKGYWSQKVLFTNVIKLKDIL